MTQKLYLLYYGDKDGDYNDWSIFGLTPEVFSSEQEREERKEWIRTTYPSVFTNEHGITIMFVEQTIEVPTPITKPIGFFDELERSSE